jgi:hypothetical protein
MKKGVGILFLFSLLFMVACKKPADRKCWKSAGENQELRIDIPEFSEVFLGPHIKFTLVQDTAFYAIVKGGENLVQHVSFSMNEGVLEIRNENKCTFLRSYKKEIEVELHFNQIDKIQFEGTKPLHCKNQLTQDYLAFVIRDGAGEVNLDINCLNLNMVVTHGWGNFDLRGELNYLKLETNGSGFGTTYGLQVNDSLHVISNSSEDVRVAVGNALLRAQTKTIGDIYFKGLPSVLEYNQYGTGALIDDN